MKKILQFLPSFIWPIITFIICAYIDAFYTFHYPYGLIFYGLLFVVGIILQWQISKKYLKKKQLIIQFAISISAVLIMILYLKIYFTYFFEIDLDGIADRLSRGK